MKDAMHITDEDARDARRLRVVRIGHLALFALVLAGTAATLGRARADDPAMVVLRLPWVGVATAGAAVR
jgi:hypothetical protein